MIKPWLVADYLRRTAEAGQQPTGDDLHKARNAIIDSDDNAAQYLYLANGSDESIRRLITFCGLSNTTITSGWWSMTSMPASDAALMGLCLADGRAAGPTWTPWVLQRMREVRGTTADADQHPKTGGGRWGIISALPTADAEQVSIKNGWTRMADGSWDVNCLAIHPDWILAVMLGYPNSYSLEYGAQACASVTRELFANRLS